MSESPDDIFSKLTWLEPDQNPFHLRVLDCRPFSTTMLSVTKDQNIAARFTHLRSSSGEEYRGKRPGDPVTITCALIYSFNGDSRDGPLSVAQAMEDKWDIYLYDGHVYFTRSWTGDLVFRAAIEFTGREAIITAIEAQGARFTDDHVLVVRMVDFLVKTHLFRKEAPHPLPEGLPHDNPAIALYSFSEYGRWAYYASFEDTTSVRIG